MGLPFKAVDAETMPPCSAPALALKVILTEAKTGETRGRIVVNACSEPNAWSPFGKVAFRENSSISVVDGTCPLEGDRSGPRRRVRHGQAGPASVGSTTLKVENRLPFTISNVVVRAGNSSGSPSVPFEAVGVGPARSGLLPIQAAASLAGRARRAQRPLRPATFSILVIARSQLQPIATRPDCRGGHASRSPRRTRRGLRLFCY